MSKGDQEGGNSGRKLEALLSAFKEVEGERSVEDRQVWSQVAELLQAELEGEDAEGPEAGESDDDEDE